MTDGDWNLSGVVAEIIAFREARNWGRGSHGGTLPPLRALKNRLVQIHVAVTNLEVESAVRIRADPRFVVDRRSLATEVGQREQFTAITRSTLWKFRHFVHLRPCCTHVEGPMVHP